MTTAQVEDRKLTRELATFAAGLRFEDLPEPVAKAAAYTLLDFLGVAIDGSRQPHARAARALSLGLGEGGVATVLGGRARTAPDRAAFLNGLFGSSGPNLDDVCKESLGHPGVGVHPAVLAVSEHFGASGRDAITAIVAGYEVAMRVGAAIGADAFERGWHPRGGPNVFGAACAVARLRGGGEDVIAAALGLAGNRAGGVLAASFFHDAWYTLSAASSHDGVVAGLLAEQGFTAGDAILEDARFNGYCRLVSAAPDWDRLVDGLGEDFEILKVYFKTYPASATTHAAIDATLALVSEHDIAPAAIDRIRVHGYRILADQVGGRHPRSALHASISVPYLVSVAAVDRTVTAAQLRAERLIDPQLASLQDRVELVVDERLDRLVPRYFPARVEIVTRDGRRVDHEVITPRGDPENPLTHVELERKFTDLIRPLIAPDVAGQVTEMVRNLADVADVRVLGDALRDGLHLEVS